MSQTKPIITVTHRIKEKAPQLTTEELSTLLHARCAEQTGGPAETKNKRLKMVHRTDLVTSPLNRKKLLRVIALRDNWRSDAMVYRDEIFTQIKTHGWSLYPPDIKGLRLTGAIAQNCSGQVHGMMGSWLSNLINRFVSIVKCSTLKGESRHYLLEIARTKQIFIPDPVVKRYPGDAGALHTKRSALLSSLCKRANSSAGLKGAERVTFDITGNGPVPAEILKLRKCIMRRLMKHQRLPRTDNLHPALDARCTKVALSRSGEGQISHWATIATGDYLIKNGVKTKRREMLDLPLPFHARIIERQGEIRDAICLIVRGDRLDIAVISDMSKKFNSDREKYLEMIRAEDPDYDCSVGLDWGLNILAADDKGNIFGRNFRRVVEGYDDKITKLAAGRQSRGLPVRCPKYDKLVKGLRGYIKSEVNRIINQIIKIRRPTRIITERLDFRGGGLSRRLNRLISNIGRSALKEKLQSVSEQYGIETAEVQPAFSSTECPNCHYTDPRNRKDRDTFVCQHCGRTMHADCKGAKTLIERFKRGVGPKVSSKTVFAGLCELHFSNTKMHEVKAGKSLRRPRDGKPIDWTSNRYVKSYSSVESIIKISSMAGVDLPTRDQITEIKNGIRTKAQNRKKSRAKELKGQGATARNISSYSGAVKRSEL